MDPLTAISLASNIIGFVDFASKLISQGYEIYESASGTLQENIDLEVLTNDLALHVNRLKLGTTISGVTVRELQLQGLASKCAVLADDISLKLNKLKVDVNSRFKSFSSLSKAWSTVWGKKDLQEKVARLESFRSQLQFGILISMKEDIDLVSIQQSKSFGQLGADVQKLVQCLIQDRNVFTQELLNQTKTIGSFHQTTEINIKQHIDLIQSQVMQALSSQQLERDDRRKEDAILQHLQFSMLDVRYEDIDPAHAKTFDWIFEGFTAPNSSSFTDWLEGCNQGENLYWICGKAGSGKSTLMKYIYDDPRTKSRLDKWTEGQSLTMASFFFWISGTADQCSQTGLIRSLLYHILSQHRDLIRDVFPTLWKSLDTNADLRAWSLSFASQALKSLLARDLGKVVLFIDGLDEYHGDHRNNLDSDHAENYMEIVDLINSLTSPKVKICFSSRPLLIFHNRFGHRPKLRLQDLTHNDIHTYIKDKLDDDSVMTTLCLDLDWNPSQLIYRIVEQAEGVFLWVILVVRSLLNGIENFDDVKDLENRLRECPSDLMTLYRYMLKKIHPSYLAESCKIFEMVDTALVLAEQQKNHGPMSQGHYEELCMIGLWFGLQYSKTTLPRSKQISTEKEIAQAIQDIERKLKTRCAGLLEAGQAMSTEDWEIRDWYHRDNVLMEAKYRNRSVKYIHRSVKEFLALDTTKSLLDGSRPNEFNSKAALLWSAIERTRIHEDEPCRPAVDRRAKEDLSCLADSALLLAQALDKEGEDCYVQLLGHLDLNMRQKAGIPWITKAMYHIYEFHNRYNQPYNYVSLPSVNKKSPVADANITGGTILLSEEQAPYEETTDNPGEFIYLDPQFGDDLLSLAIVYGLQAYVNYRILENSSLINDKTGRPYLDYALTSYNKRSVDINPGMVRILLTAGANPNSYCPTAYSLDEWEEKDCGRRSGLGYDAWTPWRSALESILLTAAGKQRWRSEELNHQQGCDWIETFRHLLEKEVDVSVDTWAMFKHIPDEVYTVSEVIQTVFSEKFPVEATDMIARVEELSQAQGCKVPQFGSRWNESNKA